jgi:hypothetical protein
MNHKAIYALYPNVITIDDTDGVFDANGNQVTIDESAVNTWQDPDQYKFDRASAYPQLTDQLDMLWHAIDSGTLDKTSDFYTTLKQVKDTYPKESS